MTWKHLMAVVRPAVTAASAVLAGAMVLAGPTVLTGATGAEALAATAGPHHLGMFSSWSAAQKAAKFKLLMPSRTAGLKRNGLISVSRCELKKLGAKHVVSVSYGSTPFHMLWLTQNNAGKPCTSLGKVTRLGTVKVDGVKAVLSGKCGMKGLKACTSSKIFLFLTWTKHGIYYVASSFGESRGTLKGFATGLRPVR